MGGSNLAGEAREGVEGPVAEDRICRLHDPAPSAKLFLRLREGPAGQLDHSIPGGPAMHPLGRTLAGVLWIEPAVDQQRVIPKIREVDRERIETSQERQGLLEGRSIRAIAKATGVSTATVQRVKRSMHDGAADRGETVAA